MTISAQKSLYMFFDLPGGLQICFLYHYVVFLSFPREKFFPVSVLPQEDQVNLSSDLKPRREVPTSPLPKKFKKSEDSHSDGR